MVGLIVGSAVWLGFRLFGPATVLVVPVGVALLCWGGYAALLTAIMVKLARSVRLPMWAVALAVLWGGLPAAAFAQMIAFATRDRIANALGSSGQAWTSALAAPIPEEVVKAAGVVLLMVVTTPVLRNPLCGMVLGALVGIGFNAAEGLVFSVSEMARSGSWEPLWSDLFVRGVLTGLVTHSGLSAIVGAGVGYLCGAVDVPWARRVNVLGGLLVAAIVLHALIDTPLLDDWGVGGVIVKQIPVVVAVWVVRGRARSEEVHRQRLRRIPTAHTE
ncbi:MAG: PrsW family intramembrane metalloprotease [Mycobacterium sp.]|nr:PrsW family intramembrane metalloprotease [Mycobacterium sp.]